jgi:hypothetical protein
LFSSSKNCKHVFSEKIIIIGNYYTNISVKH